MKKILLVVSLVSVLLLAGCNKEEKVNNNVSEVLDNQQQDLNMNDNSNIISSNENIILINDSNVYLKDIIPVVKSPGESFLGKIKLDDRIYDVKYVLNEEGEYVSFYENDSLIKSFYFAARGEDVGEQFLQYEHPLFYDLIIFKNRYLIALNRDDGSSLTFFDVLDSNFEKVYTFDTDYQYSYKVENDGFYYSHNERDLSNEKDSTVTADYYKADCVLREENGIFSTEILNRDYENIIEPVGQT